MLKKSFAGVFCLILLTLSVAAGVNNSKEPGDQIDNFTLTGVDGNTYSIDAYKNQKAIVVIFWSTVCPNVQPYNQRVSDLYKEFSPNGIAIWAINSNNTEPLDEVKAHY